MASDLKKLERQMRDRITSAIAELGTTPRPVGCRALRGPHKGQLRIRVGDFRLVYYVDDQARLVEIVRIGDRKEVY